MRRLVSLVLLWAGLASAHDADVVYVSVQRGDAPDVLALTATLTPASLALLAPLDADGDGELSQADLDARVKAIRLGFWEDAPLTAGGTPCTWLETGSALREGFVELHAAARCGAGELRQDFKILRVLPANYRVVLGSQLEGESRGRAFAQGSLSAVTIPRPVPEGSWDPARFESAVDAGRRRGQSWEVMFAVSGLFLLVGNWRRGMSMAAVMCGVAAVACAVPLRWMPASNLLILVALGAAVVSRPGAAAVSRSRLSEPVEDGRDERSGLAAVGPSSTGSDRPGAGGAAGFALAALLGFAVGAREGGGGWVTWAGLAASTVVMLFALTPIPLAVGVVLAKRPPLRRVVRWLPFLAVAAAVLAQARLSS